MAETEPVRLPKTVIDQAEKLAEEMGFATMGEAVRHMCQEGGFDV